MMQPHPLERNHRILIIDDNRAIHDDFRKILSKGEGDSGELAIEETLLFGDAPLPAADFEVDSAYQGQEGLAMVERSIAEGRSYAMAFVDVRMPPGWDGVETIEHLWRVCPTLQVVVCTAYSDYSWAEILRRLGHSDNLLILKKPFDNIEVTQLAYALTKKWWASREASARMEDLDQMVAQRTMELQRAEAALRVIFEASPIGIGLSDMEARFLRINQAFEQIAGLTAGAIIGKNPVELGWLGSEAQLEEIGRQLASFGCVDAHEMAYSHPLNGQRTGLLWLRSVVINYTPHVLSFFLDITDRKQMEEDLRRARLAAEAAARAKSEFLANMSHEIRTPLNGVLGLSALIDEKDVAGEAHSMIQLIRASGETLAKILDDVLDYSKIECGKLDLEQAPFSPRESLAWGVDLFKRKAAEKHLDVTLEIGSGVPERVIGDATRVRQVLVNLISNAIKFTEQGSIRIWADLVPGEPIGRHRIRVRVRDTGIGIEPGKAGQLFQAFTQLDPSTNRRFGGTGLGLAICKRLVEMMGGSIWVDSRPDEGSEFSFDFVVATVPSEGPPAAEEGGPDLSMLRILLAEDNLVNQVVAERMLGKLGCRADMVADGSAAMARLAQGEYDLVLLDVQMPGVDGLEVTRRIRGAQGRAADLPIVALTASATTEDRNACLAVGMDDYLSKPLSLEALRSALIRWSKGRTAAGNPDGRLDPAPETVGVEIGRASLPGEGGTK